jgi:hypothetical protein
MSNSFPYGRASFLCLKQVFYCIQLLTMYSRTLQSRLLVSSLSQKLCDDSASCSIGDKYDRVEPDLASFPENVAAQYVMTYEYAKLDLLYTISTIYN